MKAPALSLALLSTAAFAQSDDWRAQVERTAAEFRDAVAREELIPFVLPHEHPDVTRANAAYLGMSAANYRDRVMAGYQYSREQSDIRDHQVFLGNASFGRVDGIDWALVPYRLDIELHGKPDPAPQCNRLLIFRMDGQLYLSPLVSALNQQLVAKALPQLGNTLESNPADCPVD